MAMPYHSMPCPWAWPYYYARLCRLISIWLMKKLWYVYDYVYDLCLWLLCLTWWLCLCIATYLSTLTVKSIPIIKLQSGFAFGFGFALALALPPLPWAWPSTSSWTWTCHLVLVTLCRFVFAFSFCFALALLAHFRIMTQVPKLVLSVEKHSICIPQVKICEVLWLGSHDDIFIIFSRYLSSFFY